MGWGMKKMHQNVNMTHTLHMLLLRQLPTGKETQGQRLQQVSTFKADLVPDSVTKS